MKIRNNVNYLFTLSLKICVFYSCTQNNTFEETKHKEYLISNYAAVSDFNIKNFNYTNNARKITSSDLIIREQKCGLQNEKFKQQISNIIKAYQNKNLLDHKNNDSIPLFSILHLTSHLTSSLPNETTGTFSCYYPELYLANAIAMNALQKIPFAPFNQESQVILANTMENIELSDTVNGLDIMKSSRFAKLNGLIRSATIAKRIAEIDQNSDVQIPRIYSEEQGNKIFLFDFDNNELAEKYYQNIISLASALAGIGHYERAIYRWNGVFSEKELNAQVLLPNESLQDYLESAIDTFGESFKNNHSEKNTVSLKYIIAHDLLFAEENINIALQSNICKGDQTTQNIPAHMVGICPTLEKIKEQVKQIDLKRLICSSGKFISEEKTPEDILGNYLWQEVNCDKHIQDDSSFQNTFLDSQGISYNSITPFSLNPIRLNETIDDLQKSFNLLKTRLESINLLQTRDYENKRLEIKDNIENLKDELEVLKRTQNKISQEIAYNTFEKDKVKSLLNASLNEINLAEIEQKNHFRSYVLNMASIQNYQNLKDILLSYSREKKSALDKYSKELCGEENDKNCFEGKFGKFASLAKERINSTALSWKNNCSNLVNKLKTTAMIIGENGCDIKNLTAGINFTDNQDEIYNDIANILQKKSNELSPNCKLAVVSESMSHINLSIDRQLANQYERNSAQIVKKFIGNLRQSHSAQESQSHGSSYGTSYSSSRGTTFSTSRSTSFSTSRSTSFSTSNSTSYGKSTGTSHGSSIGGSVGASFFGLISVGGSAGSSRSTSTSTSYGESSGTSHGTSSGTSHGISNGTSEGISSGTSNGISSGTSFGTSTGTSSGVASIESIIKSDVSYAKSIADMNTEKVFLEKELKVTDENRYLLDQPERYCEQLIKDAINGKGTKITALLEAEVQEKNSQLQKLQINYSLNQEQADLENKVKEKLTDIDLHIKNLKLANKNLENSLGIDKNFDLLIQDYQNEIFSDEGFENFYTNYNSKLSYPALKSAENRMKSHESMLQSAEQNIKISQENLNISIRQNENMKKSIERSNAKIESHSKNYYLMTSLTPNSKSFSSEIWKISYVNNLAKQMLKSAANRILNMHPSMRNINRESMFSLAKVMSNTKDECSYLASFEDANNCLSSLKNLQEKLSFKNEKNFGSIKNNFTLKIYSSDLRKSKKIIAKKGEQELDDFIIEQINSEGLANIILDEELFRLKASFLRNFEEDYYRANIVGMTVNIYQDNPIDREYATTPFDSSANIAYLLHDGLYSNTESGKCSENYLRYSNSLYNSYISDISSEANKLKYDSLGKNYSNLFSSLPMQQIMCGKIKPIYTDITKSTIYFVDADGKVQPISFFSESGLSEGKLHMGSKLTSFSWLSKLYNDSLSSPSIDDGFWQPLTGYITDSSDESANLKQLSTRIHDCLVSSDLESSHCAIAKKATYQSLVGFPLLGKYTFVYAQKSRDDNENFDKEENDKTAIKGIEINFIISK